MSQAGAARCRPGPRTSGSWEPRLLIGSALFFLLFPCLHGRHPPSRGSVLVVVTKERWRLCGRVVLDPKDHKWSCCREVYPFHHPTQRCCQTWGKVMVIPADLEKSEAEDCGTYPLETLALAFTEGLVCYQIAGLCQKLSCIPASHCVTLDKCPALSGPNLPVTK